MPMTPRTLHLSEQARKEMDSGKLMYLTAELCRAIDSQHEENLQSRRGCAEDCREYEPAMRSREVPPLQSLPMKARR
jgi:hypothetical protein